MCRLNPTITLLLSQKVFHNWPCWVNWRVEALSHPLCCSWRFGLPLSPTSALPHLWCSTSACVLCSWVWTRPPPKRTLLLQPYGVHTIQFCAPLSIEMFSGDFPSFLFWGANEKDNSTIPAEWSDPVVNILKLINSVCTIITVALVFRCHYCFVLFKIIDR